MFGHFHTWCSDGMAAINLNSRIKIKWNCFKRICLNLPNRLWFLFIVISWICAWSWEFYFALSSLRLLLNLEGINWVFEFLRRNINILIKNHLRNILSIFILKLFYHKIWLSSKCVAWPSPRLRCAMQVDEVRWNGSVIVRKYFIYRALPSAYTAPIYINNNHDVKIYFWKIQTNNKRKLSSRLLTSCRVEPFAQFLFFLFLFHIFFLCFRARCL